MTIQCYVHPRCLVLFIGVFNITAASLLSIGTETIPVRTVRQSVFVGPQTSLVNISAPLALLARNELCDFSASLNISGSVVIVHGPNYAVSLSRSSRYGECAELRGAHAVVISQQTVHPGWAVRGSFNQNIRPVSIPVLDMSEFRLLELMDLHGDLSGLTFTVIIDSSRWDAVFESWSFIIGFRVIIPAMALYAFYCCVSCLEKHYKRMQRPLVIQQFSQPKWISTRTLIICILLIEILSTIIVFFYCAIGPLFSQSTIPYAGQLIFMHLPPLLSMMSSLYAVALFIRWGTVTSAVSREIFEKTTVAIGTSGPILTIMLTALYVSYQINSSVFFSIGWSISTIATLYAFAVFLYCGVKFIKRMQATREEYANNKWMLKRRNASLARFFKWIKVASIANFMLLAPNLLGLCVPDVYDDPYALALSYWILYTNSLFQSISQAYGLKPETYTDEEWRGIHMDRTELEKKNVQSQAEQSRKLHQDASAWKYHAHPVAVYASTDPKTLPRSDCHGNDAPRTELTSIEGDESDREGKTSPVRQCPVELDTYVIASECVV